ncbi:deoxyribose-phosphate aldolase [Robertkochia solimangrovi]|uniref:deoxyribose-phosphate aldolase n=1 Tax=Robertkochia solimangrovi TaxID=2213046 RepID=UPI00117E4D9C|nr:deoxyribose-phosphate aldolase [Robertkochia solimangrovi]TRZ45172.1 deoxyribose-phosphate aldolase [Robertkochia solimangrovi]
MKNIAAFIDHTLLTPTAVPSDIEKLCKEAMEYNIHGVCVNGCYTDLAVDLLKETSINICTVIGFPLGSMSTPSKVMEAENAVTSGADEIDMVINQGWVQNGYYSKVLQEIHFIKRSIGGATLKIILETGNMNIEQMVRATETAMEAGADFIKTSTGFGPRGASLEDIRIIRKITGDITGIKASGGIKTLEDTVKFIKAGASRIGTSNGAAIIKAANALNL